jgi:hypothetical protein
MTVLKNLPFCVEQGKQARKQHAAILNNHFPFQNKNSSQPGILTFIK